MLHQKRSAYHGYLTGEGILDTEQFLKHILPAGGPFYMAMFCEKPEGKKAHTVQPSIRQLADKIKAINAKGLHVWHACAAYASAGIPTGEWVTPKEGGEPYEKVKRRVQENVAKVRSFWIDLDCGAAKAEMGQGYATQKDAVTAVYEFCKATGFPTPLLVNSGNGVHAYWVMDRDISADMWTKCAHKLHAILANYGVKQDSSRTTDRSSVLRPHGTLNRKNTANPKPVKVVGNVPPRVDTIGFFERVKALVLSDNLSVSPPNSNGTSGISGDVPAHLRGAANSDLSNGVTGSLPVDADKVADNCQQLRWIAENPEKVAEPQWRAMLGIVKFCQHPEEFAVAWSEGHAGFDRDATLEKLAAYEAKPTTCAYFESQRKGGCDNCPAKAADPAMVSPIKLGVTLPENAAPSAEQAEVFNHMQVIPWDQASMGKAFALTEKGMLHYREANGKPTVTHVTPAWLQPCGWDDGGGVSPEASSQWVISYPNNDSPPKQISIPMSVSNAGAGKLAEHLGKSGLPLGNSGANSMQAYIQAWMNRITSMRGDPAVVQFGWQSNGDFVIGARRFQQDGSVAVARLSGDAANPVLVKAFSPSGSLDRWVRMVDSAYNHDGQQQYQFMFGAGFGCPLLHLMNTPVKAVTISGWSAMGGRGKSTAAYLAMSIYGEPQGQELQREQATVNAMMHQLGVVNSMPVLLDEMTNIPARQLSSVLYTLSSGQAKQRLKQDGSKSHNGLPWNTMALLTGNRSLINNVASEKTLASGEMCRVFEFEMKSVSALSPEDAADIFCYRDHHGVAADVYIAYIVSHQQEVRARLIEAQKRLNRVLNITDIDRFISAGITATYVGLEIAKELGLHDFDMAALLEWIKQTRGVLAANIKEVSHDGLSAFGIMLHQFQHEMLVTNIEGDLRKQEFARVERAPRGGEVVGRNVMSKQRIFLRQSAVMAWCSENQTDPSEMRTAIKEAGILAGVVRYGLGKGCNGYELPPVMCWEIDAAAMSDDAMGAAPVHKLQSVK